MKMTKLEMIQLINCKNLGEINAILSGKLKKQIMIEHHRDAN